MTKENKPLVVIDTNLLVSVLISKGDHIPHKLITAWRKDIFYLVITEEIIEELKRVLKREKIYKKYSISPEEIERFIAELQFSTQLVAPLRLEDLPIHSRDKKDDILLACTFAGKCDYLITGDEDLLVLNGRKELGKLKIIKAAEFLKKNMNKL